MSNNKEPLKILQDTREPELQLIADINDLNVEFVKKFMKIGDYQFGDLIIERKQIDDLVSSIFDRRINTQIESMKKAQEEGKTCVVMVVGRLSDRTSEINENCVLGKMVSIVMKHNIKMMFCDNEMQFCYMLKNLCEKYEKMFELKDVANTTQGGNK